MIWTVWEQLETGTTFSMEFTSEDELLDYEEQYRPAPYRLAYSKTINA